MLGATKANFVGVSGPPITTGPRNVALLAVRFMLPALPEEDPQVEFPLPLTRVDPTVPKQLNMDPASETETVALPRTEVWETTRSAPPPTLSVPEKFPPAFRTRLPLPETEKVPAPREFREELRMIPELATGIWKDPESPDRLTGPPPITIGREPVT